MKIKNLRTRFIVIYILFLSCIININAQRKGGLLDVFSGDEDPTKDREVNVDKDKTKADPPVKKSEPAKPGPELVSLEADPKALDERIKYIENLDFEILRSIDLLSSKSWRMYPSIALSTRSRIAS